MEKFKRIPGFGLYEASDLGRIKTYNWKNQGREAIMKPAKDKCGYLRTMLKSDNGKLSTIKVHRIIAQTFLDNPKNLPQVNHINGIKDDNRLENLEWCSVSDNLKHSYIMGFLDAKGEKNPAATITESEVLEIRANYIFGRKAKSKGDVTKKDLAEQYGVTVSCIKNIVLKKTWKHLL